MKTKLIAATLVALAFTGARAHTSHFDELANLPFAEGRPTKELSRSTITTVGASSLTERLKT
jgi:hypothetical protein